MRRRLMLVLGLVLGLAPAAGAAVTIQFDYTYDTSGFFSPTAHPGRRELLEFAAASINRVTDDLQAIVQSGDNTWEARFNRPDTGQYIGAAGLVVPADTLIVYVGAQNLGGSLGMGGPGGFSYTYITPSWADTVRYRGETGAAAAPPTDFGPWGGAISFHENPTYPWYFGTSAGGLGTGQADFVSVAMHELAHVLGFGTAASWSNNYASGATFTGPVSVAAYGGNVPLDAGKAHWAEGTPSTVGGVSQETAMDPTLLIGTRKWFTDLDFAGLDDVGWSVAPQAAVWGGNPDTHWDNGANWSGQHAPSPAFTAVFSSAAPRQPQLYKAESARRVDFQTADWTLAGAFTLTVYSGGIASAGSAGTGANAIASDVAMGDNSTWTVGADNVLSLNGALTTAGYKLTKNGPGKLAVNGTQNHNPGTAMTVSAGTLALGSDAGSTGHLNLTLTVSSAAVEFGAMQHLAALSLGGTSTATVTAGGAKVITVKDLNINGYSSTPTAKLDLTDNDLVVDYAGAADPVATIRGYLVSAYDNGNWDLAGIGSTSASPAAATTLGYADDTVGQKVTVKYTYLGDANLDGQVNAAGDFVLYLQGLNKQAGPLGDGGEVGGLPQVGTVPEPATLALLALGGLAVIRRRRK